MLIVLYHCSRCHCYVLMFLCHCKHVMSHSCYHCYWSGRCHRNHCYYNTTNNNSNNNNNNNSSIVILLQQVSSFFHCNHCYSMLLLQRGWRCNPYYIVTVISLNFVIVIAVIMHYPRVNPYSAFCLRLQRMLVMQVDGRHQNVPRRCGMLGSYHKLQGRGELVVHGASAF